MPTLRTRTIKTSGGDYTSLSAWEAGEQADLTATDEIREAECYAMNDTTGFTVTLDGWTTSATQFVRIRAEPNAYARLAPNFTSTYRVDHSGTGNMWSINEDNVRVEGVTFRRTNTAGGRVIGITGVGATVDIRIEQCVFVGHGDTVTTNDCRAIAIVTTGTTGIKIVNCVAIDWTSNSTANDSGGAFVQGSVTSALMYNCTVYNCRRVWAGATISGATLKNVGYDGNGTTQQAFYSTSGGSAPGGTNNGSNLADAPGSNPRNSVSPAFVNEGADNLHLDFADTAWLDQGADLSGDATYPVSIDFDGRTRGGTWEIGADEPLVLAAGVGGFTLAGQAAGLRATRIVGAGVGTYTLTGQAVTLLKGRTLTADAGAYTLTGQAAGLHATRLLAAGVGAFVFTGVAAGLYVGRRVAAGVGTYSLGGQNAGLYVGRRVIAGVGVYTLTGQDVTFIAPSVSIAGVAFEVAVEPLLSWVLRADPAAAFAAGVEPGVDLNLNLEPL